MPQAVGVVVRGVIIVRWSRASLRVIRAEADEAGRVDWNESVDSSIVQAHHHSATAKRSAREDHTVLVEHTGAVSNDKNPRRCRDEPGDHAFRRSGGGLSTKIHAAVDGRGRPLAILLTPRPGR